MSELVAVLLPSPHGATPSRASAEDWCRERSARLIDCSDSNLGLAELRARLGELPASRILIHGSDATFAEALGGESVELPDRTVDRSARLAERRDVRWRQLGLWPWSDAAAGDTLGALHESMVVHLRREARDRA